MRKAVCLLSSGLIFLIACASTVQVDPDKVKTQKVVEFENTPKNEIYDRSLNWLALNFGSAREIIELQDRKQGKIIGNIYVPYNLGVIAMSPGASTKLILDFQDNRARITLIPVEVKGQGITRRTQERDMSGINQEYNKIIQNYKTSIEEEDDEW